MDTTKTQDVHPLGDQPPNPMSTSKDMLVSNENAPPLSTEYVTRIAKEVHAEAPNTESACVGIALAVRDIYDIEVTKLRAELDEALGALEPFAKFGAAWIRMPAGKMPDDAPIYAIHGSTEYAAEITIGQLKEAHNVLSKHSKEVTGNNLQRP